MAKFILDGQVYGGGNKIVKLTQAEYDALPDSKNSDDVIYTITDAGELSAVNMSYDGSETGLGNNVQDAIDELNSNLTNKKIGFDLLWENPSPDSPFAAQTLTIENLSEYKVLFICAKYDIHNRRISTLLVNVIGQGTEIVGVESTGKAGRRGIEITSEKTIEFDDGYFSGDMYNNYLMPACIYGLKL